MKISFIKPSDVEHEIHGFNVTYDNAGDKEKFKKMLNAEAHIVFDEKQSFGITKKKVTITISIEHPG